MTHVVRNLSTGQTVTYVGVTAQKAVVCAFYQYTKQDWHTWDYDFSIARLANGRTWVCGDWAILGTT